MEKRIFVSAIITAGFYHFGEYNQRLIVVNKIIRLENPVLLDKLDDILIDSFGEIEHKGDKYPKDKIAYKIKYNTINSL